MDDITMYSIEKLSSIIRKKELSPREILSACIERIHIMQPVTNAYVYLDFENAEVNAKKAEEEIARGNYKSRLHGIPVAFKDLFYVKGIPTTAGSKILKDFIPEVNATIVQRMEDAGAITLGKTNTQEFAIGPTTRDTMFGAAHNPWNPQKITGGSSGGSAAAVAAGMAYIGMGTDTGGSIRIPSSMCGVVGFKPTYGLTSLYGIVPMCPSMDHVGPLCRSVADAAITLDAVTGTDEKDPCREAIRGKRTNFYSFICDGTDLKGKTIGIPTNFFFDKTDYEVEAIFRSAIAILKDCGAQIRYVELPMMDLVDETGDCIVLSGTTYTHQYDLGTFPERSDDYTKFVAARLHAGYKFQAVQYIKALKDREKMKLSWEKLLTDIDIIAVPTCPNTAFDISLDPCEIKLREKNENGIAMCSKHTRLANLLGCPALTVPAGLTGDGLPVGMMLMGRRNDDATVLYAGYVYEKNFEFPKLNF